MPLSTKDIAGIKKRYTARFKQYGYSPKTLGWDKGKQDIRFEILTSQIDLTGKHILDIGCGFGDLNRTLSKKFGVYQYTGIDIVEDLVEKGKNLFKEDNIVFITDDYLKHCFSSIFHYGIASGIFNFKIEKNNNYLFIEEVIKKTLSICNDGLAFDFLSNKVDYEYDHTFHSAPEIILEIAYKYSRNIVLRNDYMPFEFSLFIFKDDSYKKETTVFNRFKSLNEL
jgi:SAM-dependent methyltransferase